MEQHLIFQGDAKILLHGQNALVPLSLKDKLLVSAIGAVDSDLIVNEHREETLQVIRKSAPTNYPDSFPDVFNQAAWIEILYSPNNKGMEINLYETTDGNASSVLWLGVLENNLMPAYEVEWEIFKALDDNNTAFCAFVLVKP